MVKKKTYRSMARRKKTLPPAEKPQLQDIPQVEPQPMEDVATVPMEDTPEETPQEFQDVAEPDLEETQPAEVEEPEEDRPSDAEIEAALGQTTPPLSDEEKALSLQRMGRSKKLFESAKDARRRYDKDWLARDLFRRGYQFTSVNGVTGTVNLTTDGRARVPVNLMWAYIRSIKNQVTSFNPKWEVLPEFSGKKSEANARLSGKLLDYLFVKNNMNKKIKEAIIQGLVFSVGGPFEVAWDQYYDNGPHEAPGEVVVTLHDPYDVYIDPKATEMGDANFVVKAVRTSLDEIKHNPNYRKDVRDSITGGSPKKAESEYKQFMLQTIQVSSGETDENESTILKEIQMKERDDYGNVKIRFLTWCDEAGSPLRDELVDQEDFDLEIFQADMNPLEIYGDAWAKHVMALNRVINALESSVYEYNYRYAKGRLVVEKNSGIKSVTNEHGSIIEIAPGRSIKPLPLQPLPSSVENQILRIKAMMEDISGVHDASLGRAPSAIKSGIGIAELKQSDSSNQDDLVQNLEQCLMRLGRKILNKVAQNYTTPRIRKVVGTGRLVEHFAVVGEGFVSQDKAEWKVGEEKYPLAQISTNNELTVTIGSWLAYTKEGRQKTLMDLAEAGIIDKETVLKHMEFPDVQDIVDRARRESIIEMKRKSAPTDNLGISQEQLAEEENGMLIEGNPMPVDPEDDHELHIAIHTKVLSEDDSGIVADHIAEHRRVEKGGGSGPITPQAPAPMPTMPTSPVPPMAPVEQPPQIPTPDLAALLAQQPPPPPASYFSAGVTEVPPTSSSIMGGAGNTLPL